MKFRIMPGLAVLAVIAHGALFAQTGGANNEYNVLEKQVYAYLEKGDIVSAVPLLKRMHELKPDERDVTEAIGLFSYDLGSMNKDMGNYTAAEKYYLDAKAAQEKVPGKEHPAYALTLMSMGSLYERMGNFQQAEKYYLELKTVREKTTGKNHPDYATSLSLLGGLYGVMGKFPLAEQNYLEAKTIREKTLGKNHPDYAMSLSSLGILYFNMGNYTAAEQNYLEAKAIRERILGKDDPDYAVSLNGLGMLYQTMGNYALAEQATLLTTNQVNRNFSFLSEQQRNAYWNFYSSFLEASYSLSLFNPAPASNILNYDNALFSKGLLLRTTNAVRDAIYASGNQTLITQFEELGRLRRQISALLQKEGSDEAFIKSLETKAEALDKSLTQSSAAFRELQADLAVNWQSVRGKLRQGEAAVEFVSFQVYDKSWTNKIQYAALVLKPGMNAPAWVPLCDEETLQGILDKATGSNISRTIRNLYDGNGLELFNTVWKPLERELSGVTTVYYSPSGLLHKIAFNALPVDDSLNTRLADKYNLNLVSSTREVVNLNRSPAAAAQISSAVLYGGLDYNADEAAMRRAAQSFKKDTSAPAIASVPEGVTRGGAWAPLPATRVEAQNIQRYLNTKKIPNTLYQDSLGNEESFKQLDGKKTGLIHLATHGFFLADVERKNDGKEQQQRGNALRAAENPLLRSGLLLAGGNHAWTNNPVEGVESGILTAEKIAGMNLSGGKLVVMSACQTGLGDVKNGEGVFGLQRAFKLAGVETLIMSLWEVDDNATAKLMSTFYQEWLLSGKSKQQAFKEAQRQVRAEYPSPFYWAAFVMMD